MEMKIKNLVFVLFFSFCGCVCVWGVCVGCVCGGVCGGVCGCVCVCVCVFPNCHFS